MTLVDLSVLVTEFGGFGPVSRGTVTVQYMAGLRPAVELDRDEVRFSKPLVVEITGDALSIDLTPTRGESCVKWTVEATDVRRSLTRWTSIPDTGPVVFADLVDVDPASFEPTPPTPTLLQTIDTQVAAYMVEHPAGGVQATVDPADAGVLLLDYPDFLTDPDDDLILVLPIGA